ncbi:MAG: hypothetical protein ING36_10335 [Burkholderiales bacterium]|nr:hypothetical protein [Burkholderiales bacterium]
MRTSTTLAIDPTRIPWPGAAWNNPGTSRVKDVTDLHLVREAYGPSGEPYKLLVGKLSGKEAYVLMASNGERMLLKDLQGNLVTDPREVESLVQVITGGHLVAGLPAVILSGPALAAVVAAVSAFTWSYLSATSEQDKTAAINQFVAAINDARKKFPEQVGAIAHFVKTTLETWLGETKDFGKIVSSLVRSGFGWLVESPDNDPKPPAPPTERRPPPVAQTQQQDVHQVAPTSPTYTPPTTAISFGTNLTIPNTQPVNLIENLSKVKKIFDRALQGTIGSHQDFVDLWNQLNKAYQDLVALHENLRDPLPPGVTLTQLLVNYQQELIQRRVASLQSALSKDPKAVGAVRQQLEMLEKFLDSKPGLQMNGVSAYARKLIELLEKVINRSTPSGVTGAPPAAEFNLGQVAQQIQSLGVKYPGLQTYLQDILRLPAEERWQKLQHLLNGTVSAPGMPPMGPDDQKLLKMVIEGLCNALGSTMFDSLQGKSLEQQLQGLSIAFVVGALTEGNLETRIDVFVANALAAGLEDYVRQLAGLDPAQSGLNNIINMLFGGGLGLGMNELAGLFFKSLSKHRPELVGGNVYQAEVGNDPPPSNNRISPEPQNRPLPMVATPGGSSPTAFQYEEFVRLTQGGREVHVVLDVKYEGNKKLLPGVITSNGNDLFFKWKDKDGKFTTKKIIQDVNTLEDTGHSILSVDRSRTGYDMPFPEADVENRSYTEDQLSRVLNKAPTLKANYGFMRAGGDVSYIEVLLRHGLLSDVLDMADVALFDVREVSTLALRDEYMKPSTHVQQQAIARLNTFAEKIKTKIEQGSMDVSDGLASLMAAADALNISPNYPSLGFSTLYGNKSIEFVEEWIATKKIPRPGNLVDLRDLLTKKCGLSEERVNQMIFAIEEERKRKNLSPLPKDKADEVNSQSVDILSSIKSNHIAAWCIAVSAAAYAFANTLSLAHGMWLSFQKGKTEEHTQNNLKFYQENVAGQPWYIYAGTVFSTGSQRVTAQSENLVSGAYEDFFTLFPTQKTAFDSAVTRARKNLENLKNAAGHGGRTDSDEGLQNLSENASEEAKDFAKNNIKELMASSSAVGGYFEKLETEELTLNIRSIKDEKLRKRLYDSLSPEQKATVNRNNGSITLTGKKWLDLITQSQPDPTSDFRDSPEYKDLQQTWVDNKWIKLNGDGSFTLVDPTNQGAISQIKAGYKSALQQHVNKRVQTGKDIVGQVIGAGLAPMVAYNELIPRGLGLQAMDWSNLTGVRNQASATLSQASQEIGVLIGANVEEFNKLVDTQASVQDTTLTQGENALSSQANTAYSNGMAALTELQTNKVSQLAGQNLNAEQITALYNKINSDIRNIETQYLTALRNAEQQLVNETKGMKNIPKAKQDELNSIRGMMATFSAKIAEIATTTTTSYQNVLSDRRSHQDTRISQDIARTTQQISISNQKQKDYNDARTQWNNRAENPANPTSELYIIYTDSGSTTWKNDITGKINGFQLPVPTFLEEGDLKKQVEFVYDELIKVGVLGEGVNSNSIQVRNPDKLKQKIEEFYQRFAIYGAQPNTTPEDDSQGIILPPRLNP